MNNTLLTTVAATGFTVAFFHAAIPTHWLPFVLVSRARGWGRSKTLAVAAFAGMGHVLLTSLLGLAIAWFGFHLDENFGHLFSKAHSATVDFHVGGGAGASRSISRRRHDLRR
jgi:hypothetical protein